MENNYKNFNIGDYVTYLRKYTGVKYKGKVIEIDNDGKYLRVRNTIGNIDYLPITEVKKMAKGGEVGDYKIGDILKFKDGEDWKVVRVKSNLNKLVIKPYNDKAKNQNVSLEIDIDLDYLKDNLINKMGKGGKTNEVNYFTRKEIEFILSKEKLDLKFDYSWSREDNLNFHQHKSKANKAKSILSKYNVKTGPIQYLFGDNYLKIYYIKYEMEQGGKIGDTIRIAKDMPFMASLSNLYNKDLKIVDVKDVFFASGNQKYYIVELDGEQYEVPGRFTEKKMAKGGPLKKMAKGGGVSDSDFERDYKKVKKHIEDGYGNIDSGYVETTWENLSDITYSAIEDKLIKRLSKDGLLNYAKGGGVSDSDFERDYKKVKKHIEDGYGNIDSGYVETTWENLSDITYSAIDDKLIKRLSKDGLLNYAKGGDIGECYYSIGGL